MKIHTILKLLAFTMFILIHQSCQKVHEVKSTDNKISKSTQNETRTLTTSDWIDLFDGKSFDGWHGYNKNNIPSAWQISDGVMYLDLAKGHGGDIVTDEEYENFELSLEWKISDCGNSGIFYNVVESKQYKNPWLTGPEMQILDNKCHPDAKFVTHRAGDLYDMIETSVINVKPAGEWNRIRIKSEYGRMTFTQNDSDVVHFTMHNDKWKLMIADSKFNAMPDFGLARKGRIGLQDHGDKVSFRDIKLREL